MLEWVPGTPISSVLEPVTVKDFLTIGREIVSSLLAMHMKRFIHHNLTSDHIIVDKESSSVIIPLRIYSPELPEKGALEICL